jgi:hypothetical protein
MSVSDAPDSFSISASTPRNASNWLAAARSVCALVSASITVCLKRCTRRLLMVSLLGAAIASIGWRVARSIAFSKWRSRGLTNRIASPLRPARPVRPMRCT